MTRHTQVARINLDRLKANALEAAEQCEVLALPVVHEPVALGDLIAHWMENHLGRRLVFADETAASASPIETLRSMAGDKLGLIIGPEGGFSEEERALLLAQKFVVPISLGPRILRADTAAVAALAVIQAASGDWR
jgi:16S rRNA (uracil1498-N3)-methyltransferase